MASAPATSLLLPQAASFLRQLPEPKTIPPRSLLRWNPLFGSKCLLTKSFPLPPFVGVRGPVSCSFGAVKEGEEVKQNPIGSGGGLLSLIIESLGVRKHPVLAAALLGLFLTAASPCAAVLASSSPFPCHSSSSLLDSTRLGDSSVLSLVMMGSAAVTLLAGFLLDPVNDWKEPKLQVSMQCLPRDLDWIGEITETSSLEGLDSGLTDYFTSQTYFRNQLDASGVSHPKERKLGLKYSNLDAQAIQIESTNDETSVIEDREKLRRMRISKANKGNVPWNKGRKHSAETLQRIRERTKLAMQDPKVKMKLMNLGHAQSEETRMKISAGVREGWRKRHEMLMVQEGCFFEWQNCIADSARRGCAGEGELQWDSYKILNEQLKRQWLESMEKRKTKLRTKESKRAPKSPEQRRKISEAIAAKWADAEYRARVCSAMAKHHGTAIGAERIRRKPSGETSVKITMRKKTMKPSISNYEDRSIKKVISKGRKNSTPLYKDPMVSFKFEIIKKIKEERAAREAKKQEVTERAKLLIAEAEKAAKALEMFALNNPLAQTSLLETRKLIAEATRSIENIETGMLTTQDYSDKSLDFGGPLNHFHSNPGVPSIEKFKERLVNGFHTPPSSRINHTDIDSDRLPLEPAVNGWEPSTVTQSTEKSTGFCLPVDTESVGKGSEKISNQTSQSVVGKAVKYENNSEKEDIRTSEGKDTVPSRNLKKKWVCGRLIEVDKSDEAEQDSISGNK
nr:PREDICTED: uncharacterized protein LOC103987988 isoform X2 [Musa acuminata subsp. malaccensis]